MKKTFKKPKLHVNVGINESKEPLGNLLKSFEKQISLCVGKGVEIVCDMSNEIHTKVHRLSILNNAPLSFSTVPTYEYYIRFSKRFKHRIEKNAFFDLLEEHIASGADYVLLHSAFTREVFNNLENTPRVLKMSSRGGGIIWKHFQLSKEENPLYSEFESILDLLKIYKTSLFLGLATRPGSIFDGLDDTFLQEMKIQKELVKAAVKKGVNIIVEGVGHVTISNLIRWVSMAREMFGTVPLKPLPIVTDIGAGLDHIAHAIAVYFCTMMGVEYICCITPSEHLGKPTLRDIETGIDSSKLAIHSALLENGQDTIELDRLISIARNRNEWNEVFKYSINPELARKKYLHLNKGIINKTCSMCGNLCPKLLTRQCYED